MEVEIRRFLGNTLSVRIHDADHERTNCRLGHIASEHRRWYDSLEEARSESRYEECSWAWVLPGPPHGRGGGGRTRLRAGPADAV